MFFGFSWVKKMSKPIKNIQKPIFEGKNIHESQLFSCLLGYQGLIHIDMLSNVHPETGMIHDSFLLTFLWNSMLLKPPMFQSSEPPSTPKVVPGSFCVSWEENHLGRSFEPQLCELVAANMFNQSQ